MAQSELLTGDGIYKADTADTLDPKALEAIVEAQDHPRLDAARFFISPEEQIKLDETTPEDVSVIIATGEHQDFDEVHERTKRETHFEQVVSNYFKEINYKDLPYVEQRRIASQVIAAYWLFVGGGLDGLIDRDHHGDQQQVAQDYLDKVGDRSSKREYNAQKHGVTIGYEDETVTFETLNTLRGMISYIDMMPDSAERDEMLKIYTMETIRLGAGALSMHETFVIAYTQVPGISVLSRLGVISESIHVGETEMQTLYSYDQRTSMQDIWHLMASGILSPDLALHETFGGVEVKPWEGKTEMMDAFLVLVAAGLLPESVDFGFGEKFKKLSRLPNGKYGYTPHFRFKDEGLSEHRSFPLMTYLEARRFTRFMYFAAQAGRAHQIPHENRNPTQIQLAHEWDQLMEVMHNQFQLVFGRDNKYPSSDQMYMEVDGPRDPKLQETYLYYQIVLNTILKSVRENDERWEPVAAMVHKFNTRVDSLLGLNE